MLDSMMRNPRPTRAEVTDVANAVYDGTDAVMLSGETANGKYPVEALNMMVEIVKHAEDHLDYEAILKNMKMQRRKSVASAIGYASVTTSVHMNAKCIITPTASGSTARVVSKFKPKALIIGASPNEDALRRMQIFRGVYPLKSIPYETTEDVFEGSVQLVKVKGLAEIGDVVIVTAGIPSVAVKHANEGMSNMMRIAIVE